MFVRIECTAATRSAANAKVEVVELVSPRTNCANYTPTEHLFAALSREAAVSLEIGGDVTARRFYARVAGQLREASWMPSWAARIRRYKLDLHWSTLLCGGPESKSPSARWSCASRSICHYAYFAIASSRLTVLPRQTRCSAFSLLWAVCRQVGGRWRSSFFNPHQRIGHAATCDAAWSTRSSRSVPSGFDPAMSPGPGGAGCFWQPRSWQLSSCCRGYGRSISPMAGCHLLYWPYPRGSVWGHCTPSGSDCPSIHSTTWTL